MAFEQRRATVACASLLSRAAKRTRDTRRTAVTAGSAAPSRQLATHRLASACSARLSPVDAFLGALSACGAVRAVGGSGGSSGDGVLLSASLTRAGLLPRARRWRRQVEGEASSEYRAGGGGAATDGWLAGERAMGAPPLHLAGAYRTLTIRASRQGLRDL